MPIRQPRFIIAVSALLLVLVLGVFWLVHVATARPGADRDASFGGASGSAGASAPADGPASAQVGSQPGAPESPGPSTVAGTATRQAGPPSRPVTPTRSRDAGPPPVPSRAITVGGVTLDNNSPITWCYWFRNHDFGAAVTVARVAVSGQALVVTTDQTCQSSQPDLFAASRPCGSGTQLVPGGDGCYVGAKAEGADGQDHHGTLGLVLTVRCTGTVGVPCSDDELVADPPTATHPVDVTWADPPHDVCYRPGGENEFACG
jgi:hypothetical protein